MGTIKTPELISEKNKRHYITRIIKIILSIFILVIFFFPSILIQISLNSVTIFIAKYRILMMLSFILIVLIFSRLKLLHFFGIGFALLSLIIVAIWHKSIIRFFSRITKNISRVFMYFKTLRFKLITLNLLVLSIYIIFVLESSILIVPAMAMLYLVLGFHYLHRLISLSKPMHFFLELEASLFKLWMYLKSPEMSEKIQEWENSLFHDPSRPYKNDNPILNLWFFNRLFYRLGNYFKKSEGNILLTTYFMVAIIYTFIFTAFIFAIEFIALSTICPGSFQGVQNFTEYFLFSFSTITTASLSSIIPISATAKLLTLLEIIFSIFIAGILFFIFATVTVLRYRIVLDGLASDLHDRASRLKAFIEEKTSKKIEDLIPSLLDSSDEITPKSGMYKFMKIDDQEIT